MISREARGLIAEAELVLAAREARDMPGRVFVVCQPPVPVVFEARQAVRGSYVVMQYRHCLAPVALSATVWPTLRQWSGPVRPSSERCRVHRLVDISKGGMSALVPGLAHSAGRVLVVSPHLDDAAMSVGATLHALGGDGTVVEVLTLFAGDPTGELSDAAKHFHDLCGHPHDRSALAARRGEDRVAMEILGAHHHHGGFLDAVYRTNDHGEWLCQHDRAMFAEDLPPEPQVVEDLFEVICRAAHRADLILTCAANGGHVDHKHTYSAAVAAAQTARVPLLAWEDLPYAIGLEPTPPKPGLPPLHVAVGSDDWREKCRAVAAYRSQVAMLWPSDNWSAVLADHAQARGNGRPAEVFWRVVAGNVGDVQPVGGKAS